MKKLPGFTLIELLMVMAVLGALASMIVLQFRGASAKARDAKRQTEVRQLQNLLEIYANKTGGNYPVSTSNIDSTNLCGSSYLDSPQCVSGTAPYQYWYVSNSSGTQYSLRVNLESQTGQIFVLCSTGEVGKVATGASFSNGNCPL